MFQHVVAAVDKAYGDFSILWRHPTGSDIGVFSSISEQVQMVKEAQAHRFIKTTEDDRTVRQEVTTDRLVAEVPESQRQQTDVKHRYAHVEATKLEPSDHRHSSKHCYAHVEAMKLEPSEQRHSPQQPLSYVNNKARSAGVRDQPVLNRISNQLNAVKADKREVRQVYKEESSTVMSPQKLSTDGHLSKLKKSKDRERSQAVGQSESDVKSRVSKREKQKSSGTTNDIQKLVVEPTAENLEAKPKKPSRSRHEKKVHSCSSTNFHPSDTKLADHKVKSVTVRPADEGQTLLGGRSSSVHDNGYQKSCETRSDDEIRREVLHSFDEVH